RFGAMFQLHHGRGFADHRRLQPRLVRHYRLSLMAQGPALQVPSNRNNEVMTDQNAPQPPARGRVDLFFQNLGPGLITGCADDDPSGISTYSIAGATFGYGTLWTALISFPLMVAVQTMCGRLGMVTGRGLAAVIRLHYPRWVLWGACLLLIIANVI